MGLRWSIPLPGPFHVSGNVLPRTRPSTAGRDLAAELARRADRREDAAVRDEAFRADVAGRLEAAWPNLDDGQRAALEVEVVKWSALPHGSFRSQMRGGSVVALLDGAERTNRRRHRA